MTSFSLRSTIIVGVLAALAFGGSAEAHPKLLATTPAATSVGDGKGDITLKFSEALVAQFSGMSIMMTDMPGMKMTSPMAMGVKTSVAADGKTLVGHPAASLPAGSYSVTWHAVTADTHRVEGSYSFTVK